MIRTFLTVLVVLGFTISAAAENKVSVHFERADDPQLDAVRQHLEKNPYFQVLPLALDKFLDLPRPLPVVYAQMGQVNAAYFPQKPAIIVGYELYATLFEIYQKAGYSQQESLRKADFALAHILLHEFGHAVIAELELPVTGREEDCADEFATLLSAKVLGTEGREMALASAEFFGLLGAGTTSVQELPFWDEHSLHTQRYYKIICDLHAALESGLPGIERVVPAARIREAEQRYPRKTISWMRQLSPHNALGSELRLLDPPASPEGRLTAQLGTANHPATQAMLDNMSRSGSHRTVVQFMDETFLWPRDFTVLFTDTGDATCRYEPEAARLVISLDFFQQAAEIIAANSQDRHTLVQTLEGVIVYTMLQEMGRALIYELDLPWTGEPEDVTAEFVTLLLSQTEKGRSAALGTALFYRMLAQQHQDLADLNFWSAEPLDQQRFTDILGYLHSQNPTEFAYVEQMIPAHRRARYARDFQVKKKRWKTLLEPYVQTNFR